MAHLFLVNSLIYMAIKLFASEVIVTVNIYRYCICYANGDAAYEIYLWKSITYPLLQEF